MMVKAKVQAKEDEEEVNPSLLVLYHVQVAHHQVMRMDNKRLSNTHRVD